MNLKSLKRQVNNEKGWLIKGKITKSSITFRKNKPNSPNVQMNASLFITMIYTIFASLTKVKNKPNQTQYKPNSNPIAERPKMNVNNCYTKVYNNKTASGFRKNKPKQTQNKPNFEPPGFPGSLFIDRVRRKQPQKDFPIFFQKLPVMVLTNKVKYRKLPSLIFFLYESDYSDTAF